MLNTKPKMNPQGFIRSHVLWKLGVMFFLLFSFSFSIARSQMPTVMQNVQSPQPSALQVEVQASQSNSNSLLVIEERLVPNGFEPASGRSVDTIVLHSCYNPNSTDWYSVEKVLAIFRREGVATHYLIDRSGRIYRLVQEENIAYHAGQSRFQERTGLNKFSIGIELLNHTDDRYTEAQYQALDTLLRDLERRYRFQYLLAHGEIASERRSDPWNFDWSRVKHFRDRQNPQARGPVL